MLAQLLSNSIKILSLMIAILFTFHCLAQQRATGIQNDRTNEVKHGLFEIQQEAITFANIENKKHHTNIRVLKPDLRYLVAKCAVPLKVKWAEEKDLKGCEQEIIVTCIKTIHIKNVENKWNVEIPVIDSCKKHHQHLTKETGEKSSQ